MFFGTNFNTIENKKVLDSNKSGFSPIIYDYYNSIIFYRNGDFKASLLGFKKVLNKEYKNLNKKKFDFVKYYKRHAIYWKYVIEYHRNNKINNKQKIKKIQSLITYYTKYNYYSFKNSYTHSNLIFLLLNYYIKNKSNKKIINKIKKQLKNMKYYNIYKRKNVVFKDIN